MILELAWPYVPVAVVAIFWALEIRPLRHLLHHAPIRSARRAHPGAR
jgi:hypothetical protein